MRCYLLLVAFFSCSLLSLSAQRDIPPSDSFRVGGLIRPERVITLRAFDTLPQVAIPDLVIRNHRGELKDTLQGLKGVPFREWMHRMPIPYEKPRDLNRICLLLRATDNYIVVLSWNEVFNTDAGKQMYLLTEIDHKPIAQFPQRMAFIAAGDEQIGRRYVKGLASIEVLQLP
jgi:hypothetical protein